MTPLQHRGGLEALARAMGGDVYAGGLRALVPAPGHSAADRSVSLWLRDGRVVVHTFGGGDWRDVLDDLRDRGWIDADNRLRAPGGSASVARPFAPDPTRAERIAAAHRLWAMADAIAPGSPAAHYLLGRGLDLALDTGGALRGLTAAPAQVYHDRGPRRPALIAAVSAADGALTAVEITYLDAHGRRSETARPSRKIVGVLPPGCAVRLSPAADAMTAGEGVPTTLSAMRRFGLPGWALLSTTNLRRWTPPPEVRRLLIAADRGPDGERSAAILRNIAVARGVAAALALPPVGYGDWNDLDQEEVRRKGG